MSEAFKTASEESKKLLAKPSDSDLLLLYALYKVGNGEDIESSPAPGMFDLKGKAKRSAWQKQVDAGISAEEAQKLYIEKVEALKKQHGFDPEKVPEAVGK